MQIRTSKQGIYLSDFKDATMGKDIEMIFPSKGTIMTYPMVQHIGAPCQPTVSIGDEVLVGQKIGDSNAPISAPIFSSVSGVVKKIELALSPTGQRVNSIMIENDGLMKEHKTLQENTDYLSYSKQQYIDMIKGAGVVGLGGAGFPTHYKLDTPKDKKIDYIIVNGAECEPFLTTDYRVLLEDAEKIRLGLKIILKLFPQAKGIIAIERNKMEAIRKMERVCADDKDITVAHLKTKFPQGSEKQLIYSCTGLEVPSMYLPMDIGAIVNNANTAVSVYNAVALGRPLTEKVITITGSVVKNPGNYKVLIGMSYRDIVEQIGGFSKEPYKVINGGPMTGIAMYHLDVPIIKTSSALVCLTRQEAEIEEERNCIRCGKCVEHCPARLLPINLNRYVLDGDTGLFEKHHGMDCIECGTCSYVCPAKRHLAQSIRSTRRSILDSKSQKEIWKK